MHANSANSATQTRPSTRSRIVEMQQQMQQQMQRMQQMQQQMLQILQGQQQMLQILGDVQASERQHIVRTGLLQTQVAQLQRVARQLREQQQQHQQLQPMPQGDDAPPLDALRPLGSMALDRDDARRLTTERHFNPWATWRSTSAGGSSSGQPHQEREPSSDRSSATRSSSSLFP